MNYGKKKMRPSGLKAATAKLKKKSYGSKKRMQKGGAKPDYLDLDGDGNRTEPMKGAAKKKMMGGDYMQESNEVKFGGPSKMQRGGASESQKKGREAANAYEAKQKKKREAAKRKAANESPRARKQNTPQGTGGGAKSKMDQIAIGRAQGATKVKPKSKVTSKLNQLNKAPSKKTGNDRSFNTAFSDARKAGKTTFMWRGKKYGTKTKAEASKTKPMSTIAKKSAKAIGVETSKDLKMSAPLKSAAPAPKTKSKSKSTRADRITARGTKKAGKITAKANKRASKITRRSNIKSAKADAKKAIRAAKGKPEKKFIGGLVGAARGFRKNKGKGLGARLKGLASGAAGGSMLGRAAGALKGMRGAKGKGLKGRLKGAMSGALRGSGDEIQGGMDRAGRAGKRMARRAGRMARKGIGMAKDAASVALGGQDEMMYGGKKKMYGGSKKKVDKKLFGGRAARQERREDRQERRGARQEARQDARAQGAGFFGAMGAGMQAGSDMRQEQQQQAMGQQAQPQQPAPMNPAPPAPMVPAMMQKGMVKGQMPTKTIDGSGDDQFAAGALKSAPPGLKSAPPGTMRKGGVAKKLFGGKGKERREDRRERRSIRKAQKAEDKAALEGLSGKEKRQARRSMRQDRRQDNRELRKEQRLERRGVMPGAEGFEDVQETDAALTGSAAGGIDLRAKKVGLDTGGGAAKRGGFKDRRKGRKKSKTMGKGGRKNKR